MAGQLRVGPACLAALMTVTGCVEVPTRDDPTRDGAAPDAASLDGAAPNPIDADAAPADGAPLDADASDGGAVDHDVVDAEPDDLGRPDATPLDPTACGADEVTVAGADACLRFVQLADLPLPRADQLVAALPDGALLVVGGTEDGGPHGEVPTLVLPSLDGEWEPHPQPETPRLGATLTMLDGRALLMGGQLLEDPDAVVSTVEVWDPANAMWQAEPPMAAPHTLHSTIAYGGALLSFGGRDGVEDTATVSAWPAAPPQMPPSLIGPRRFPGMFALGEALVHVGGTAGGRPVVDTWVWRPGQETWMTALSGTPPPLAIYSRGATDGDTIVLTGGRDDDNTALTTVRLFDLVGRWRTPGALSAGRERHVTEQIGDGLFVVLGGAEGGDLVRLTPPGVFPFATPEAFEARRKRSTITRLSDGSVVVVGGKTPADGPFLDDAWHISLRRLEPAP